MAVLKSKLNSKLPRVSGIRFCTSGYKNMCESITTGENGRFSIWVCFKQPTNRAAFSSYQVQYREHSQYTAANAKKKGTSWTAWSKWKNMIQFGSGTHPVKVGSTKDPNTWLSGNRSIWNQTYSRAYVFDNAGIGGDYVRRAYQVRIRSYNGKKRQHGAWVYSNALFVIKKPPFYDETVHRSPKDGGIILDVNYKWDLGGTLYVNSIRDSSKRELLKAKGTFAINTDRSRSATTVPPKRDGFTAGRVNIPIGRLKRAVEMGERLDISAYYQTKLGSKTYFNTPLTVRRRDTDINPPRVVIAKVSEEAAVSVKVYKAQAADVIDSCNISLKYVHNGKTYNVPNATSYANLKATNTTDSIRNGWFPHVPLNTDLTVTVTVSNGFKDSERVTGKVRFDTGNLWFLHRKNNSRRVRAVLGGGLDGPPEFSIRGSSKLAYDLPYGRRSPFAAFSPGAVNSLTLRGAIAEAPQGSPHPRCRVRYWNEIKDALDGVYVLRGPGGEMYEVAIEEISLDRSTVGVVDVSASFVEVA